jgi:hypothetical protein
LIKLSNSIIFSSVKSSGDKSFQSLSFTIILSKSEKSAVVQSDNSTNQIVSHLGFFSASTSSQDLLDAIKLGEVKGSNKVKELYHDVIVSVNLFFHTSDNICSTSAFVSLLSSSIFLLSYRAVKASSSL